MGEENLKKYMSLLLDSDMLLNMGHEMFGPPGWGIEGDKDKPIEGEPIEGDVDKPIDDDEDVEFVTL